LPRLVAVEDLAFDLGVVAADKKCGDVVSGPQFVAILLVFVGDPQFDKVRDSFGHLREEFGIFGELLGHLVEALHKQFLEFSLKGLVSFSSDSYIDRHLINSAIGYFHFFRDRFCRDYFLLFCHAASDDTLAGRGLLGVSSSLGG
jgi:hypothetical protein